VDDLLDISRANSGKLHLELGPVDITSVVADTINACRPAIDVRLQRFSVTVPATAVFVRGDLVRLTQILTNLLDNASKYTPNGGAVSLTLATTADWVTVTVTDGGIGISEAALPGVFELFVQDPSAIGFSNLGLGIGLRVVHELVTAHGGTVVAHSDGPGQGSQFVVTLPSMPAPIID